MPPCRQPGVLLVASEELHNSIFRQSVVLVYQHSAAGASGIMLTKPLDPRRLAEYPPGAPPAPPPRAVRRRVMEPPPDAATACSVIWHGWRHMLFGIGIAG